MIGLIPNSFGSDLQETWSDAARAASAAARAAKAKGGDWRKAGARAFLDKSTKAVGDAAIGKRFTRLAKKKGVKNAPTGSGWKIVNAMRAGQLPRTGGWADKRSIKVAGMGDIGYGNFTGY